jgi:hypothetical protein
MRVLSPVFALCLAAPALFGCTLPDVVYSGMTGKNCSMVRLESAESYCHALDPPLEPQQFCTRSLGTVDCWQNPQAFPGQLTQVGSAPQPTAEQEAYRTRRWPDF